MEAVAETKYSLPLRSCVSLPMRRPLLAGLALAVCVATPLAAAQGFGDPRVRTSIAEGTLDLPGAPP